MAAIELGRLQPSAASMVLATTIIAGLGGYFLGQASSLGLSNTSFSRAKRGRTASDDDVSTSDDETDSIADLNDFKDKSSQEHKLVLVVRSDLGMSKGKIAAQCSHATLACYKTLLRSTSSSTRSILRRWERTGQGKVAVQVKGEEELLTLQARAVSLGLCAQIVRDAGRTQIAAGSATVLGVGPGPKGVVDMVTGHLKLL